MAVIWLGDANLSGLGGNIWFWVVVAVASLFVGQSLYMGGLGLTHVSRRSCGTSCVTRP